jgi:hypothetical protein
MRGGYGMEDWMGRVDLAYPDCISEGVSYAAYSRADCFAYTADDSWGVVSIWFRWMGKGGMYSGLSSVHLTFCCCYLRSISDWVGLRWIG